MGWPSLGPAHWNYEILNIFCVRDQFVLNRSLCYIHVSLIQLLFTTIFKLPYALKTHMCCMPLDHEI
jgi:hypothetical protein